MTQETQRQAGMSGASMRDSFSLTSRVSGRGEE